MFVCRCKQKGEQMKRLLLAASMLVSSPSFSEALVPNKLLAQFIKIFAKSSDMPLKIACDDPMLSSELRAVGLTIDSSAKIVWANSNAKAHKGKLVFCPAVGLLKDGGCVAIILEDGKPIVYLHLGNIQESGVTISDTFLKIGRQL
jgi:hypothetical protein